MKIWFIDWPAGRNIWMQLFNFLDQIQIWKCLNDYQSIFQPSISRLTCFVFVYPFLCKQLRHVKFNVCNIDQIIEMNYREWRDKLDVSVVIVEYNKGNIQIQRLEQFNYTSEREGISLFIESTVSIRR